MKNKNFKFNDISRLIERDGDINVLTDFLEQLHTEKCGILRIVATHGSGATSFLNIASSIALKHNYEVIKINEYSFDIKACNINDFQNLESCLSERIKNNKKNGQIIIIDSIDQMDREFPSILKKLLSKENNFIQALIYSTKSNLTTNIDYVDVPVYKTIFLEPLSPKGLHQLLETVLVWDKPPETLLEYLYNKTQGLPKYIKSEIEFLIKKEIIIYDNQRFKLFIFEKVRYFIYIRFYFLI